MIDSNPIGFAGDDHEGIEFTTGFAGEEVLPEQWGVFEAATSEYDPALDEKGEKSGTPFIKVRLVADKELSATPGKSFFGRIYLSKKKGGQQMFDGLCVAFGLGPMRARFGEATSDRDKRPLVDDFDAAGDEAAKALKTKKAILFCEIDKGGEKKGKDGSTFTTNDQNKIGGFHRITDDNIKALKESGFLGRCITKKSKMVNGKKVEWLEAKPVAKAGAGGNKGATPATTSVDDIS